METQTLQKLYDIIISRREKPEENSYTCYLFKQGLDKILKKIGEESAETIIAAKNNNKTDIVNECADLIYHLCIMLAYLDIPVADLTGELEERMKKMGNLKEMKNVDKNS